MPHVRDLTWGELIVIFSGLKFVLNALLSSIQVLLAYFKQKPGWSEKALARFELAQTINSVLSSNIPHPPWKKES